MYNILGWSSENRRGWLIREIEKVARRKKKAPGRELIRRAANHLDRGAVKLAIEDLDRYMLICLDHTPESLANLQSIRACLVEMERNRFTDGAKSFIAKLVAKWLLSWMWQTLISFPQISFFEKFCFSYYRNSLECAGDRPSRFAQAGWCGTPSLYN